MRLIALLGSGESTDGIADYCANLGEALARRGVDLEQVRVLWQGRGRLRSLLGLWRNSTRWRDAWVILHYTALSWSRRGFPGLAVAAVAVLRIRGIRCAVLFHEHARQHGSRRWRDAVRGAFQDIVIRLLHRVSARSVFTVPPECVAWLPAGTEKARYIPIGSNIPPTPATGLAGRSESDGATTVAVFCLSRSAQRTVEVADLGHAIRHAASVVGAIRLVVTGKGTEEARSEIESALSGSGAEVHIRGRLPRDEVSAVLGDASAFLYLCGMVSQTRGSALAGVACGLPIVGYSGLVAGTPMEQAGLELVPYRDREALGAALLRVLTDDGLRESLRERSRQACDLLFSWEGIARSHLDMFGCESPPISTPACYDTTPRE